MIRPAMITAAAAAAMGVLFSAPVGVTAMPLAPVGPEVQLATIVKQSSGTEQAARRYYKRRYAYRYPRHRYRYRYGGCWNCGYRRFYGAPFFFGFGFGFPYYAYPYYGPRYYYPYRYRYRSPYYYGGYYGRSIYYGGKRN